MLLLFVYWASKFCWGCAEIKIKLSEAHSSVHCMLRKHTEVILPVMSFVPVLFHVKEMIFLYISLKRMDMFGDDQNE
jgi:TRAP-type C4-dicarboxylate transport system permease small subunit